MVSVCPQNVDKGSLKVNAMVNMLWIRSRVGMRIKHADLFLKISLCKETHWL